MMLTSGDARGGSGRWPPRGAAQRAGSSAASASTPTVATVPVVAAPSGPSIARRSVAVMAAPMGEWSAGQLELDVLVDVGRWGGQHGEAAPLVVAADVTVVVCVPVAEQLVPARQLVATITELGGRPGWCLVGDGPYSPAEVAEASAAPVLGVVPSDPRGAAAWADPESKERTRRRSGVASAAAALSHHLVDQLRPVPEPAPASVIPPAPPTEASPSEPMTDSPAEVSQ